MSKKCQNVDLGGSPENVEYNQNKMSNGVLEASISDPPENVKKYIYKKCHCGVPKWHCWTVLTCCFTIFNIFLTFSERPSQIDILTLLLTFSGKSGKTPVTLGSSDYGSKAVFFLTHFDIWNCSSKTCPAVSGKSKVYHNHRGELFVQGPHRQMRICYHAF